LKSQSDNKSDSKRPNGFNYVASEGTKVVFDLHDLIIDKDIDIDNMRFQSYRQMDSKPAVDIHKENDKVYRFTAPYVKGNQVNTKLNFKLTIKDKNDNSSTHDVNVVVKRVHRAMIFQGGVSLGAYEAGVFSALVEKISKEDESKKIQLEDEKRPLFDIVAGASIGAMNGAIVVSNVIRHRSWEDSSKEVIKFWKDQEYPWPTIADSLDLNPIYHYWWDFVHSMSKVFKHSTSQMIELYSNMNRSFNDVLPNWFSVDPNFWKDYILDGWYVPATAESCRRYYSAKQFDTFGAPNVASGIVPWSIFGKFFDLLDQSNSLPRPDNKHLPGFSLKRSLEQYARFPIKTDKEKGEPRFLLVTVDVKTGDAVTFDSYSEKIKYHNEENYISYNKGIEIDHVLASGTFPGFFDYPKFQIENESREMNQERHFFWDGGFRSNTPLREIIQAHRDYWHKTVNGAKNEKDEGEKEDDDVPDLEVYIADLWPSELKEEPISFDRDFVENRKWGILFGDKTDYDEQVANFVTDYVDLAKQLRNLAESKGASKDEINHILDGYASSRNTKGQTRRYKELLGGRFRLTKVVRIDRKDDGNEVGNKIYDYSQTTIEMLMKDGYRDALLQMGIQSVKDEFIKLDDKFTRLENKKERNRDYRPNIENLKQDLQQIQKRMKIEDGHDDETTIMNQVDKFISEVRSVPDIVDHGTLQEEKALLINAAKQFQEVLKMIKNHNLQPQML
jgi:predicted acylesterase/phospholipase RssA